MWQGGGQQNFFPLWGILVFTKFWNTLTYIFVLLTCLRWHNSWNFCSKLLYRSFAFIILTQIYFIYFHIDRENYMKILISWVSLLNVSSNYLWWDNFKMCVFCHKLWISDGLSCCNRLLHCTCLKLCVLPHTKARHSGNHFYDFVSHPLLLKKRGSVVDWGGLGLHLPKFLPWWRLCIVCVCERLSLGVV